MSDAPLLGPVPRRSTKQMGHSPLVPARGVSPSRERFSRVDVRHVSSTKTWASSRRDKFVKSLEAFWAND